MSAPAASAPSTLSKYATTGAMIYYALVLPAVVLEAVFSVAIASTPGDLVAQNAPYGDAVAAVVRLLPLAILVASAYAILSFRPSVLITMLTASFFVAVSVSNGIYVLGARLDLGETVISVVAAAFLALAGFTSARGVKLLGGRRPVIRSSGPLGYNVLGIVLDFAVPLATALGVVLLVEQVVAALTAQAANLPSPLSTLTSLYLQSRVGIVFTTILVAGAAVWAMRQFVEPVILHFTLSAADARRELLSEIEPTSKSVRKISRYRPSTGLSWGILTVVYCAGIFSALAYFLPWGGFYRDLLATLNLHPPPPSPIESLFQSALQNGLVKADILFARSQDILRDIIRLLWG